MSLPKILRSLLDVDGKLTQKELKDNYLTVSTMDLRFMNEEDRQIYDYVQGFASQYGQLPTSRSVLDFLDREGDLTTAERLKEIQAVPVTYTGADYQRLIHIEVESQRQGDMHLALKMANDILFDGVAIKEGRETVHYKGYRDAMLYLMKQADGLINHESGARTKADIIEDTDAARDEIQRVLTADKLTWGCLCGLEDIDLVCRGLKPGELWTHAAFTGELKCFQGSCQIFDHSTKKLETAKNLYDRVQAGGAQPVITALKQEGAEPLLVQAQASHLVENGVRDVYTVKLKSGRELEITDNHPLWASKQGGTWVELKELSAGDWVGVPSVMRVPEPREDFTDAEVEAIGFLLGDGSLGNRNNFGLTANNEEVRQAFVDCLETLGYREGAADYETPNYVLVESPERAPFLRVSRSLGEGNSSMVSPLANRLVELGLWDTNSHSKFIPGELFGLPEAQIELLLGALWATDGSCHTGDHAREDRISLSKRNDITYASVSKELAQGVQGLLLRLAIPSTVREVETTYKGEPYLFYTVRVTTNPGKRAFCERIRVPGKQERFDVLQSRLRAVDDRIFPTDLIAHLDPMQRVTSRTGSWRYAGQAQKRESITGDGLRLFTKLDPELERHLEGDVAWDQIESITLKGQEMTYDLSVPEHHSFVVNDVITHNTTFALNWVYRAAFLLQWNVYYLSLEMPVDQLQRIMYVMHSNHPKFQGQGWPKLTYRLVRDGEDEEGNPITEHQLDFYYHLIDDIEQNRGRGYGSLYVHSPDEDMTIPKLKQALELRHAQVPVHMCVIDHFALMKPAQYSGNYYTDLNSILRDAKRLALSFNQGERLALLGLLQINRQGKLDAEKNDGVYKMQALADANEAERSSDVITTTFLDTDLRARARTKFGCLKNRDNPHFLPFNAVIDWDTKYIANEVDFGNHAQLLNASDEEVAALMQADTDFRVQQQEEREQAREERLQQAREARATLNAASTMEEVLAGLDEDDADEGDRPLWEEQGGEV